MADEHLSYFLYIISPSSHFVLPLLLALVGVLLLTEMQCACCLHHLLLVLLFVAAVDEEAREPIEAFIRSHGVPIKLSNVLHRQFNQAKCS
eukprot:1643831-Pleurochrysis_carterae.AAC.1